MEILGILLRAFKSRFGVFGYIDETGALVVPTMTPHVWDRCQVSEKAQVFPRDEWGESIWPRAIRQKKILHSNERSLLTPEGHVAIDRNIAAPVIHRGEVVGLFQIANKDSDYDDNDLALAQAMADAIAPILAGRLARERERLSRVEEEARRLRSENALKLSEERIRGLLGAMPDVVLLCAADGTFLDCHTADTSAGSGNTSESASPFDMPGAFLGKKPADVFSPGVAKELSAAIALALETGCLQTFEYEVAVGDSEKHSEVRVAPAGNRPELLVLVRDITDVVHARRELEDLVQSKDDFIATISHELRTPLTGILGYAHLLHGGADGMTPEERQQITETLVDQSTELAGLVEDLLVSAKADLGRLRVARVKTDLRAQVAQVLEAWDPAAIPDVELSGPVARGIGDPARVRQIVRNLITNALRYGGSRIRITTAEHDPIVSLQISDNGSGIYPDDAYRVFEAYEKCSGETSTPASLGVGLFISRQLARLMGGDLSYRRENSETIFELTLPSENHNHTEYADPATRSALPAERIHARATVQPLPRRSHHTRIS
ncbi:GAF domain-containing protein [bacterium]|nr:GAF domain-containing protein [bacterium]